ncbi:MAG TPA: permease [Bacteroidales bacterium]|nr:permease [Bacteroidales bacterium]HRZ48306.1 permease [Bacteroidales bacterium]
MKEYTISYFQQLYTLSAEMAPYLLLGFLFAGILHVYIRKEKITRYLGANSFKSVLYAALLGVPLPLCSCGVIPTGIAFHRDGASRAATVSFLISTPQTGVDSILVTWSLLGWPFAVIRPVVALLTGILGGSLSIPAGGSDENLKQMGAVVKEVDQPRSGLMGMLRYAFVDFMEDIAKWLVIGLAFAALIAVVIPDNFFTVYMANPYLSMLVVLVAAVPLYVCATGSVPVAAILLMKGLSPGAVLVFLMAGPATNIATITVIGKALGRKTLLLYLISIIGGALLFGTLTNLLIPSTLFTSTMSHMHDGHHHLIPEWVNLLSLGILTFFIGFALLRKTAWYRKNYPETKPSTMETDYNHQFVVTGMTCQHCRQNVEKAITSMEGVSGVEADITSGRVKVKATSLDMDQLRQNLSLMGYGLKSSEER